MICDAHCHLDLMDNMLELISEAQRSNVKIFAVGTTPRAYSKEIQFCKNVRNIKVGLGMHPQLVSSDYDDLRLFKSLFEESYYIGEVGLDFSRNYIHTKELQINRFIEIIKLCEQYGERVVSIHSLKSTSIVIKILEEYRRQSNNKYIFHWFTGSTAQLEKIIRFGGYFSVNPNMLKTKSGIDIIKALPVKRILLETDAPFTFNVQNVDEIEEKLKKTVLKISDIVGNDMMDIICENSKEVFKR